LSRCDLRSALREVLIVTSLGPPDNPPNRRKSFAYKGREVTGFSAPPDRSQIIRGSGPRSRPDPTSPRNAGRS